MRCDSVFPELHPKGSLLWPSPRQGLGKAFRVPEVFLPPPLTAGQLLASFYGGLPLPPQPSERRGDRRDPQEWVGVGGSRPGVDSETMRPMESRFLAGAPKFQGSWKSEDPSSLPEARPSLSHAPTVLLTPSTRRLERSGPMAVSPSRLCVCLTVYVINTYAIIKMQRVGRHQACLCAESRHGLAETDDWRDSDSLLQAPYTHLCEDCYYLGQTCLHVYSDNSFLTGRYATFEKYEFPDTHCMSSITCRI